MSLSRRMGIGEFQVSDSAMCMTRAQAVGLLRSWLRGDNAQGCVARPECCMRAVPYSRVLCRFCSHVRSQRHSSICEGAAL